MTLVHYTILNNSRDTDLSNAFETTFDHLYNTFLNSHNVAEDKDGFMMCPWIFRNVAGPRKVENVVGASMICLDFDDKSGWTVDDAKAVFAKFEHIGYTSFQHQKVPGVDRFRIVLPLADAVSGDDIVARRKAIYEKYAGVDQSSLSRTRGFYIPLCPSERQHLAQAWKNDGELFDLMAFAAEVYIPRALPREPLADVKRQWIIDGLSSIYIGREPEWRNIGLAMCNEGFSFDDFRYVTMTGLMHEKTFQDCQRKWKAIDQNVRDGVRINAGHLINVLKRHGKDYKQYLAERKAQLERQLRVEANNGNV